MKKKDLITVLFLVSVATNATRLNAQASSANACENSTVADAWGPQYASEAKLFLAKLKKAINKNDKKEFASLVHYPANVFGTDKQTIQNPSDLIRKYSLIVTPEFKRAILTQSSDCLFGNGQGVMVGGGRIWFQKQPNGEMKIITFNIISSKASD
jgi:hypothetical protein